MTTWVQDRRLPAPTRCVRSLLRLPLWEPGRRTIDAHGGASWVDVFGLLLARYAEAR